MNKPISLAITTYNRTDMLFESFARVINDKRILEVVIVDDASPGTCYNQISKIVEATRNPKIKLFKNNRNLGVFKNKKRSVELATGEWVIVFDSDNIIDTDYLDKIFSIDLNKDHCYLPDFAKPVFDYRAFGGMTLNKENVASISKRKNFSALVNTMNAVYHRQTYLDLWSKATVVEPNNADSIYLNYLFLDAGKNLSIVRGLEYFHRVHNDSHYKKNGTKGAQVFMEIMRRIGLMK